MATGATTEFCSLTQFSTKLKQSTIGNVLLLLSSLVFLGKYASGFQGGPIFKCWFGQPASVTQCRKNGCPDNYICVTRFNYISTPHFWEGCCQKGNGPCDTAKQKGDPAMADYMPPTCLDNGNYSPDQCHFGGCYCAMPDGTPVEGTNYHMSGVDKPNCKQIVAALAVTGSGVELPVVQPMIEELTLADLGLYDRKMAKRFKLAKSQKRKNNILKN